MTLFGYGKTTKAIAKKFKNCEIFDDSFKEISTDEFGNKLLPSSFFDPNKSTIEVTSPGIAPNHPLIKQAKNLISEYDLFANQMPYSIWISGTNGKTTTTQMIGHLLHDMKSSIGGNIGKPLAQLNKDDIIWILETSSFTLYYTNKATPDLYILLPITPDHVDWHGSFENYENAKLKPLKNIDESGIVIIPKKYQNYPTKALKIVYENSYDLSKYFDIDISKIKFKEPFLLDAILALAVEKILFDEVSYDRINSFKIDRFKIEEFKDKKGRIWVNDSKATNVDATIAALKRYQDKKINLILGGDDKGADLSKLFDVLQKLNVEIFAIGKNSNTLIKNIKKKPIHHCKTLQNAIYQIDKIHTLHDIALLSPAAASLDQFDSYIQRGEKFIKYINDLS